MWKQAAACAVLLAACGDDGGHSIPVDAARADSARATDAGLDAQIDAFSANHVDAGVGCSVDTAFGSLALGSTSNRLVKNWFASDGDFLVGGRLRTEPDGKLDLLIIDVKLPATGFATNVSYANQPDATSPTYDAYAMILGDYDQTTGIAANTYWATTGATTFTAIGTTSGSAIEGATSMMSFQAIDENTGAPIAGGCTTTIAGMAFHLQQQ
jgi:hypothetical protein